MGGTALISALCTLVVVGSGNEIWLAPDVDEPPDGLVGATMFYDSRLGESVMFGGVSRFGFSAETLAWNGEAWRVVATVGPSARGYQATAFAADRQAGLLFGGAIRLDPEQPATLFGDTWRWQDGTWSWASGLGPTPRSLSAMAYDEARRNWVLFGGLSATGATADTWTSDGAAWTLVSDGQPWARAGAAMVYDEAREQVVLFGGYVGTLHLSDTWLWDGRVWRENQAPPPPVRTNHTMVFDSRRARVVLFGGQWLDDSGPVLITARRADVWEWDGDSWTETTPDEGPSERMSAAAAFDHRRRRMILFGGLGIGEEPLADTWEYLSRRSHLSCAGAGVGAGWPCLLAWLVGCRKRRARQRL